MKKIFILCALFSTLMLQAETIQLDSDIDYVQANYSVVGGVAHYTFLITNYDNDVPAMRLQTNAASKTAIWGTYQPDVTFSKVTLAGDPDNIDLTVTSASLTVTFVSKDLFGDCTYTIHAEAVASDGNTYTYDGTQIVYAFDADNDFEAIELTEGEGPITTGFRAINVDKTSVKKIIRNGQVLILRDGKTYNAQGGEL